ncbi:MAG: methionyl-tRNA formyltransferase [Paenibacillaceae bacterium]
MNILFMGTPEFAIPSLRMLIEEGYNVVAVITQPDRPKGRKKLMTPPPVKEEAERHQIPVYQPQRMRDPAVTEAIAAYKPDLIVTAAYGQILPKSVLAIPRLGCINIHGSLLPLYRGGAPIQYAIMKGEKITGVTIMYMAEGLDTGDMISRIEVPIEDEDDAGTLFEKLSVVGASLLKRTLPDLIEGRCTATPQNDHEATYARVITRDDERLNWSDSSMHIFNHIRALRPWPGAYTLWNNEVFKIWSCLKPEPEVANRNERRIAGTVISVFPAGIIVSTGDGTLTLTEVQPAGKTRMPVSEFVKNGRLTEGTVFSGVSGGVRSIE